LANPRVVNLDQATLDVLEEHRQDAAQTEGKVQ